MAYKVLYLKHGHWHCAADCSGPLPPAALIWDSAASAAAFAADFQKMYRTPTLVVVHD